MKSDISLEFVNEHCFDSFLNDPRFEFCTKRIINDIKQASYPKEPYVSFLDHILISKKLIKNDYHIQTVLMGEFMDGYENYERLISDHLPVFLSF